MLRSAVWTPLEVSAGCAVVALSTESNRIHLVLFGIQNRTFGPYLAAINRILVSVISLLYLEEIFLQTITYIQTLPNNLT
jgi:hypothetical protein